MDQPTVLYSKTGAVAHVVLNRPEVINAYDVRMRDDLFQTLEAVRDDPEVLSAVLSGAGDRGFCAGADLTEFGTAPSQATARSVRWERDVWGLFLEIEKPLVAALHGHVIGSGVEMACLCDVRIASEDAVFRMPEAALGMIPAAGGTQTLFRVVGLGHALDMMLSGRAVAADEARELGLVHEVVERGDLGEAADRAARELAARDPGVVSAAKSAVLSGMELSLEGGLALEERAVTRIGLRGASG